VTEYTTLNCQFMYSAMFLSTEAAQALCFKVIHLAVVRPVANTCFV